MKYFLNVDIITTVFQEISTDIFASPWNFLIIIMFSNLSIAEPETKCNWNSLLSLSFIDYRL